jgi:GT2 family glycosyltransferase
MFISIIIIVKGDKGIRKTLASLQALTDSYKNEIIVVDGSEGKLADIQKQFPHVVWVPFKNKTNKKITIPEQRNVGVRTSKGDVIVFIDANCEAQPNWLEELVKPIINEGESVVCGEVLSQGTDTMHDLERQARSSKHYLHECPTINLAIKRDVINQVGSFDEKFDYGSDVDYSWRMIEHGYKIRYQGTALISHDWGSAKDEMKRAFRYGKARARLYKKHKHKWRNMFTKDIYMVIYPVFLVGLPLTLFVPWYPLLLLVPLIKNRKQYPVHVVTKHLVYASGVLHEVVGI